MGEGQIFVKFAREEVSLFQHFKVVLSVPVSEEKMSQPNNGPNMKQTNMKQSVVDHHKLKCTIQKVVKLVTEGLPTWSIGRLDVGGPLFW